MDSDDLVINIDSINDGFTQSEMQMWDNCAEKWYLRYNLGLAAKSEFSWATTYGGWIHAALEEFYLTKGKRWSLNCTIPKMNMLPQHILEDYEYWKRLAEIQMKIYASFYKNDFEIWKVKSTEYIVDLKYRGVRLKGMIDLFVKSLVHGGYYVVDHKTSYKIDRGIVMGWDFRFQFMFYCWLSWKMWGKELPIKGYFINAIKKPQLRRGKTESVDAFLQRVQSDMLDRPENYFYRERLRLRKGDLIHFQENILDPKIERIKMIRDPKISDSIKSFLVRNKNTDHCIHYNKACQFMGCCKNGLETERHLFIKRDAKHQELVEESTDNE